MNLLANSVSFLAENSTTGFTFSISIQAQVCEVKPIFEDKSDLAFKIKITYKRD